MNLVPTVLAMIRPSEEQGDRPPPSVAMRLGETCQGTRLTDAQVRPSQAKEENLVLSLSLALPTTVLLHTPALCRSITSLCSPNAPQYWVTDRVFGCTVMLPPGSARACPPEATIVFDSLIRCFAVGHNANYVVLPTNTRQASLPNVIRWSSRTEILVQPTLLRTGP